MYVVKDRFPNSPAVGGLPNAAARRAEIIDRRLAWDSRDTGDSSRAMRADETPLHGGERFRVVLSLGGRRDEGDGKENETTCAAIHVGPPIVPGSLIVPP